MALKRVRWSVNKLLHFQSGQGCARTPTPPTPALVPGLPHGEVWGVVASAITSLRALESGLLVDGCQAWCMLKKENAPWKEAIQGPKRSQARQAKIIRSASWPRPPHWPFCWPPPKHSSSSTTLPPLPALDTPNTGLHEWCLKRKDEVSVCLWWSCSVFRILFIYWEGLHGSCTLHLEVNAKLDGQHYIS